MTKFLVFSFLAIILASANGASIFAVFSSLNHADQRIYRGYIEELAKANHHILVMTPEPGYLSYPEAEKIVEISVQDVSEPFVERYRSLVSKAEDHYSILRELNDLAVEIATVQLKSPQITGLLMHPDIKFDLIVTEADVPLLYALAAKYKVPHVAITASSGKINMYDAKGNPNHAILYPDVYSLHLGNMSIFQKTSALKRHVGFKYEYYHDYLPKCQAAANDIFGTQIKDLQELEYDIDILFVTGTPMMIGNRPTVPAIIYVDRLHIKPNGALPPDVKLLLDKSDNGVIYFSLGATYQSSSLSKNTIKIFTDAFKELPFTILWVLDNAKDITAPPNVHVSPWLPQQEILAHKNVKAFITHGGPRAVEEAMYYTTPIIGIPFVQHNRVLLKKMIKFNAGILIEPYDLEKDSLIEAITQVATNSSYKQSIEHLKNLVYDQPWTGAQRAVWWTEYVIRHNGAMHLRAPAVGVPLWKYFMLDVIATVLLIIMGILTTLVIVIKKILSVIRRKALAAKSKWKML